MHRFTMTHLRLRRLVPVPAGTAPINPIQEVNHGAR